MKPRPLIMGELLKRIVDLLRDRASPSYIAGGYVRDWLLGQAGKDIDFAVVAAAIPLARQIANVTGGAFYVLDEETDAARVVYRPPPAAPPKAERGTEDLEPERVVDFAGLRGGDILADLRGRDFTINAMAVDVGHCDLPQPPILDPCDGQTDLTARILRATNEEAFRRDPVRLLRAVRFVAALGMSIEPLTESWIRRDAALIAHPSAERIRQELALILAVRDAASHVRLLDELGLLQGVLPELVTLKGVSQSAPHHLYDVYEHTLRTVAEAERLSAVPEAALSAVEESFLGLFRSDLAAHFGQAVCEKRTRASLLKLAAMLHDVGKPEKRTVKESGRVSFWQHERLSSEITRAILSRLRFSTQEIQLVSTVVAQHMRPGFLVKDAPVSRRAMYRFFRDTGDAAVDVLILSLADHLAARGPALLPDHYQQHLQFTQQMLEHYFRKPAEVVAPPPLLTGRDVMAVLGIPSGPQVGQLLEAVREAQAAGQVRTREEALQFLRARR